MSLHNEFPHVVR